MNSKEPSTINFVYKAHVPAANTRLQFYYHDDNNLNITSFRGEDDYKDTIIKHILNREEIGTLIDYLIDKIKQHGPQVGISTKNK